MSCFRFAFDLATDDTEGKRRVFTRRVQQNDETKRFVGNFLLFIVFTTRIFFGKCACSCVSSMRDPAFDENSSGAR